MSDSPLERGREDSWFRERDRELIEKLKADAVKRAERERLAAKAGLEPDHAVLEDLEQLGFGESTLSLLHLVPLVWVAWAEGGISSQERALIFEAARAHGIEAGSPAHDTLGGWLEVRPDDSFFGRSLGVIRVLLDAGTPASAPGSGESLLALCQRLAAASGGLFGLGSVSASERAVLAKVAAALEGGHGDAARQVVDSL